MKSRSNYLEGEWRNNEVCGKGILIWYDEDERLLKGIYNRFEGEVIGEKR
jgi:hypothetical protein